MYLVKTPKVIQGLFPNFTWKIPVNEKILFLTFDDGPIPEVTPWVLKQLKAYHAKATFFCVGDNVAKHREVLQQVIDEGHSIGNHTFNHMNGWNTDNIPYFHNIRHCAHLVKSNLFRPPYGKIRPRQAQFLQRHYRIVMWDVLSGDFDPRISIDQCYNNVIQNASEGSIVVFHDSLKAIDKLRNVLPRVLKHYSDLGYSFEVLDAQALPNSVAVSKSA